MNKSNKFRYSLCWLKVQSLFWFGGVALLFGCAGNAAQTSTPSINTPQPVVAAESSNAVPTNNTLVSQFQCAEAVLQTVKNEALVSAMRKLTLANDWHAEKRYRVAFDAYESVLAEQASDLTDAYALAGIIALRLDRDNTGYDREAAVTANFVLEQRLNSALSGDRRAEASMLKHAVKIMLDADVSKDRVVAENRRLSSELAERDEALQRLREVTVGR